MVVTQMTGISGARFRVYVDGKPAFILYRSELRQFAIREGQEISEENHQRILTELLPQRAKKRALRLLESRDYTSGQLREKLRQGEYPPDCIEEAVAYVESYGYVDDLRYARDFINYHLENKTRARMEQDLLRKGVSKEIIGTAFAELEEAGTRQDETAMIMKLLEKKKYDAKTATKQDKQRMCAFLYRKGFHLEAINRALLLDITLNSV